MNEPRRLWQDDGASPALRAALRAGRDDKAGAARLAAMAAGLGAAGVPVAQAAAVSGMALGTKLTLAIAIVSGLGGPAYFVMSRKPRMQEAPVKAAVAVVETPTPVVVAPVEPAPEPVPAPEVAPRSVRPPSVDISPLAESQYLEGVRASIARDPRQALERLVTYRKRFTNRVLEQEATLLHIEALVALDRKRDARAAGKRFLQQHPNSPHRPRLERLMAELP